MKKNKFTNDHRLCNDMGLIPVKITKSNIKNLLNKNNKKIFNKFNENNNGVISNCSVLLKNNNIKKGGRLLTCSTGHREDILTYCKNVKEYYNNLYKNNIINKINTIEKNYENDYMKDFINEIENYIKLYTQISDSYKIPLYNMFKEIPTELIDFFIEEFNFKKKNDELCENNTTDDCNQFREAYEDVNITIDYTPDFNEITKRNFADTTQYITFSHCGYNKDTVCAYEQEYIKNKDNMLEFIKQQKQFIKNMDIPSKMVINDYSEFNTFTLYYKYISRVNNTRWLYDYVNKEQNLKDKQYKPFHFGDSFYKQILELYPDKFNNIIAKENIQSKNLNLEIYDKNEISVFWEHHEEQRIFGREVKSIFAGVLNQEQWENVIAKFIQDVNDIILSAPPLTNDIYCYRGSAVNYIKHNEHNFCKGIKINPTESDLFLSSRLSSYSLNFDRSYEYLMKSEESDKRCMYRCVIKSSTPVLFIPQISDAPIELEILTPLNCLIAYRKYESGVAEPFDKNSYNNRHYKYGICSVVKFNSADIVIYPPENLLLCDN